MGKSVDEVISSVDTAFEMYISEFDGCHDFKTEEVEQERKEAIELIKSQQAEIERLCKKIGVMKESIEDAIMSETVFDTFDDLSSYVNAERCRSEEWTGGIRDAIQAVRAWGE